MFKEVLLVQEIAVLLSKLLFEGPPASKEHNLPSVLVNSLVLAVDEETIEPDITAHRMIPKENQLLGLLSSKK